MGKTTLAVTAATCRGGTAHVYPLGGTTHVYPLWWDFIGGIFLAVTAVTRPKVCFSCVTGNVCPKFEVTYVPGASSQSNFSRAEQENKGDDRFFLFYDTYCTLHLPVEYLLSRVHPRVHVDIHTTKPLKNALISPLGTTPTELSIVYTCH